MLGIMRLAHFSFPSGSALQVLLSELATLMLRKRGSLLPVAAFHEGSRQRVSTWGSCDHRQPFVKAVMQLARITLALFLCCLYLRVAQFRAASILMFSFL